MKKVFFLTVAFIGVAAAVSAQTYLTRNGKITFFSTTPVEDIKAENNEVVGTVTPKGEISFAAPVKSFNFPKAAMQEHFNQADYMNSDKFPKATFKGNITNISAVDFSKNGTYNVTVKGDLTLKGVTKPLTTQGTLIVEGAKVTSKTKFKVARKDFGIMGQAIAQDKIASDIEVTVDCAHTKM